MKDIIPPKNKTLSLENSHLLLVLNELKQLFFYWLALDFPQLLRLYEKELVFPKSIFLIFIATLIFFKDLICFLEFNFKFLQEHSKNHKKIKN